MHSVNFSTFSSKITCAKSSSETVTENYWRHLKNLTEPPLFSLFELSETLSPIASILKAIFIKCHWRDGSKIDWVSYLQLITNSREQALLIWEYFDMKKLEKVESLLNKALNFLVQKAEKVTLNYASKNANLEKKTSTSRFSS